MKECCKDKKNLKQEENYIRCEVCKCRHFEMIAEMGKIGIKLT